MDTIQKQIDEAFATLYQAIIDVAYYMDNFGVTLSPRLKQKYADLEDKAMKFRDLCDKNNNTHTFINSQGREIITVLALRTTGNILRSFTYETGYYFPNLK